MCTYTIKSYCAHMFKASKIFLLCFLVFQVAMMPVSQAFAERHMHDNSHVKAIISIPAASSVIVTKSQHFMKADEEDNLSGMAHLPFPAHKTDLQSQCGKRNGHKGNCDSCQCTPIIVVPLSVQVTPVLIPAGSHHAQLNCPLYSVVMAPPLRPPIS